MRSVAPEHLALVVERLVAAVRPEKIFLFGSQASGSARDASDIDVLVVVPDEVGSAGDAYAAAERSLRGLSLPVELVICTHSEFHRQEEWVSSLPHTVLRKGKLLYAA
jgi:predicted nucleotidyltransferase